MFDLHQVKLSSLERQLEFLDVLKGRHVAWAMGTHNSDVIEKHNNIIKKISELYELYVDLIELASKRSQ